MINYPNGKKAIINKINDNHSNRGMTLESDINDSNAYYLEHNIAVIYKKPTPIQVVKVDYPNRNKAKIVEAYYKIPSTTDYNGLYKGQYIDFEAKETISKTAFSLQLIHPHQITHLQKVIDNQGIAFIIIRFTTYDETYLIMADKFIQQMKIDNAKSIKYSWIKENGYLIEYKYNIKVDYIKVLNSLGGF